MANGDPTTTTTTTAPVTPPHHRRSSVRTFVCVLIEATEGIDRVVATHCHRGVDQTRQARPFVASALVLHAAAARSPPPSSHARTTTSTATRHNTTTTRKGLTVRSVGHGTVARTGIVNGLMSGEGALAGVGIVGHGHGGIRGSGGEGVVGLAGRTKEGDVRRRRKRVADGSLGGRGRRRREGGDERHAAQARLGTAPNTADERRRRRWRRVAWVEEAESPCVAEGEGAKGQGQTGRSER